LDRRVNDRRALRYLCGAGDDLHLIAKCFFPSAHITSNATPFALLFVGVNHVKCHVNSVAEEKRYIIHGLS